MDNAITLSGMDALRRRLMGARTKAQVLLSEATEEALEYVEARAKEILDQEVYSKPHGEEEDPPDKNDPDSLYASFFREFAGLARTAVSGTVGNTSEHAGFLEFGTDNEGTGSHFVPVVNGKFLHWIDAATGASAFSKGHEVKGVTPIHFLERALNDHRDGVLAIYRRHYSGLFH